MGDEYLILRPGALLRRGSVLVFGRNSFLCIGIMVLWEALAQELLYHRKQIRKPVSARERIVKLKITVLVTVEPCCWSGYYYLDMLF